MMGFFMYIEFWLILMFVLLDIENVVRVLFFFFSVFGFDFWFVIFCCRSISFGFFSFGFCWWSSISFGCSCSGCFRFGFFDRFCFGDGFDWCGV